MVTVFVCMHVLWVVGAGWCGGGAGRGTSMFVTLIKQSVSASTPGKGRGRGRKSKSSLGMMEEQHCVDDISYN